MPGYSVQRFLGGYAIVIHDTGGKRRRYRLAATDRAGAEAEAREWVRSSTAGQLTTVGDIVEAYLDAREAEGMITITRRRDAWKAMKPFWAKIDPTVIDRQMCLDYRASRRPAGDATVRLELTLLSSALGRYLGRNKPTIHLPPAPARRERHLSPAEFRKFLAAVRAPHARLYMMLGVFTLARPSALLELRWGQVDLQRGLIDLNPPGRIQTKKRRPVVPMNDMLRGELQAAFDSRDGDFVISRAGQRVASVKKAFEGASERSGVHATPYTLRHTGAVWAAEQGIPMSELAQMLGHDDSRTTEKHYARFSPQYLRRVANAVQEAFEVRDEPKSNVRKAA